MATSRIRTILTHFQKQVACFDNQTADRELLRRFSRERDETAFAEIVRRHGPMVLRVCRRVLHNGHDAEDVCQAAFLLLAQKAASSRWHDSVAGWLFQTAYRLSLKARATANRRTLHEAQARPVPPPDPVADLSVRELQVILDEELSRLPEKYRTPILLCCLEGKSRDEAARHLGWELATVKDRLEQGRERLRLRLARRGLLLGTALMSAWLLEAGARAGGANVAPQTIAKAALLIATGQATLAGLLPARVAALAEGGTPMFLNRMTILAIVGLALGLGAAGVVTWIPDGASPVQAQTPSAQSAKAEAVLAQPAALPLTGHKGAVRAVAFAPDGKTLATAGTDKTVRLWDPATGRETLKIELPGEAVGVAFSPDGKTLAAAAAGEVATLILCSPVSGENLLRRVAYSSDGKKTNGSSGAVAFSPDGKLVAVGVGGDITIFQAGWGRELFAFGARQGEATTFAFSSNGKLLAVGKGLVVSLLEAASGEGLGKWPSQGGVTALVFLPDGTKVAVADGGRVVRVLDTSTGKEEDAFAGGEEVRALALSSDGKQAATVGKGGVVRLWNASTGKQERWFDTANGAIHAVAFAPDGTRLATVDEDGTAVIWDLTRDEKPLPRDLKLTEKELTALWEDLASDQGTTAYAAQRMLRADPARSVPFLQERLKPPVGDVDGKKIKQLIDDLDADSFETRQKATRELEKLGKAAELPLRAALTAGPSLEAKGRLERLLKPLGTAAITPERQRDVRAVRVLEQAGTPEAKKLLEALMKESPGWWVTQEAKAALERLAQRDKKP